MVVCCLSGWRDAGLARVAAASARLLGWPVAYADGAYRLYSETEWATPAADLAELASEVDVMVPAPAAGPWASEAAKKTVLLRAAEAMLGTWALFLDADERLEAPDWRALTAWLWENLPGLEWVDINLYRPDGRDAGGPLPRLVMLSPDLEFRPPRDFELWRGGRRVAYLDGERVPAEQAGAHAMVPPRLLRIRHDRHLRPVERTEMSARYLQRRRAAHGS